MIKLVVGLGNPGQDYSDTRHNAGFWFADQFVSQFSTDFSVDKKFFGDIARVSVDTVDCRILKPDTYMNHSGRAVKSIMDYFDINPRNILIAHDEIDLETGDVRLKSGGGHAGHNGLRDIIEQTGESEFLRLRIGVGHPGHKDEVIDYVLHRPGRDERTLIDQAIGRALEVMPVLFSGELNKAMTLLNGKQ